MLMTNFVVLIDSDERPGIVGTAHALVLRFKGELSPAIVLGKKLI